MKKNHVAAIIFFLLMSIPYGANAQRQASYYKTYEVVEVTEKTITLRDKYGNTIVLNDRDPNDYKVGDEVRYDRTTNRLHKKPAPRTY